MTPTTRKNSPPIKVYCLPEERAKIQENAAAVGATISGFLLSIGVGYRLKNMLDHQRVEDLVRINRDLGRLGGLLKLWLTNDPRTASFGRSTIVAVLSKIEETQREMQQIMRTVVQPRSSRKNL